MQIPQEVINLNQEQALQDLETILNQEQVLLDLEVTLKLDLILQDQADLAQEATAQDLLAADHTDHQVQEVVEEEEDNKL